MSKELLVGDKILIDGESGRIITAYIPNTEKFEDDLKTRKER